MAISRADVDSTGPCVQHAHVRKTGSCTGCRLHSLVAELQHAAIPYFHDFIEVSTCKDEQPVFVPI